MSNGRTDLEVGDLIEIKYRVGRASQGSGLGYDLSDKWIAAEVVHCEAGGLPIAKLSDGQVTDIRRFMTWRRLARG
jgi:hypothetical protein